MMMEGFDFDCDQTMFDDIVIKRYTGSPEQAAAINSAVQRTTQSPQTPAP